MLHVRVAIEHCESQVAGRIDFEFRVRRTGDIKKQFVILAENILLIIEAYQRILKYGRAEITKCIGELAETTAAVR